MLCVVWTLQGTGLPQYWMMTQELDRTQEEIISLEHANAVLREEIHHLESDPLYLGGVGTGAVGLREGRRNGLSIRRIAVDEFFSGRESEQREVTGNE